MMDSDSKEIKTQIDYFGGTEKCQIYIESTQIDATILIHLKEEKLMATMTRDFTRVMAGIVDDGYRNIVLNLSGVRFLDSSGLGCLVAVRAMLGKEGSLVLCGLTGHVQSSFRLTRMDTVFDIFDDAERALAA